MLAGGFQSEALPPALFQIIPMRETCHNAGFDLGKVVRLQNVVKRAEPKCIMRNFFVGHSCQEDHAGARCVAGNFGQNFQAADVRNEQIQKHYVEARLMRRRFESFCARSRSSDEIPLPGEIKCKHLQRIPVIFDDEQPGCFVEGQFELGWI